MKKIGKFMLLAAIMAVFMISCATLPEENPTRSAIVSIDDSIALMAESVSDSGVRAVLAESDVKSGEHSYRNHYLIIDGKVYEGKVDLDDAVVTSTDTKVKAVLSNYRGEYGYTFMIGLDTWFFSVDALKNTTVLGEGENGERLVVYSHSDSDETENYLITADGVYALINVADGAEYAWKNEGNVVTTNENGILSFDIRKGYSVVLK